MPKFTVTITFDDKAEALAFLSGGVKNAGMDPKSERIDIKATSPAVEMPQTAAFVAEQQPAPPQPAAPAGAATATFEDCTAAFQKHVKKGNGRSAMTARKAIVDVLPHYQNFRVLSPEECAVAVAAMDAA